MTRQEIINALALGQNIPELKPLYETLQVFLEDMGIPVTSLQDVHRIFKRIVIDNPRFPDQDVYDFFPPFMKREYTKGKYANIEQMVEAINGHQAILKITRDFVPKQVSPWLDKWSDQEIQRQCAIVHKLGLQTNKPDGYFARLQAELEKRNLSVPDIDLGPPGPLAKYL